MANGSITPENETDQQCGHCKLWFHRRGISSHEDSCFLKGKEAVAVSVSEVGDRGDPTGARTDPESPGPIDGDHVDPEGGADPTDAVTDGGEGLGLSGPPSTPEDATETSPEPERETVDCPVCGCDLEATEAEVEAAENPVCGECGTPLEVTA